MVIFDVFLRLRLKRKPFYTNRRLREFAVGPVVENLMARADIDVTEASLKAARVPHARAARCFPCENDGRLGDMLHNVVRMGLGLAYGVSTRFGACATFEKCDGVVVDCLELHARRLDCGLVKAEVALEFGLLSKGE